MYVGVNDIIEQFRVQKAFSECIEREHLAILGASFKADKPWIFREPNQEYIDAEIEWYESKSLNVNDLFDIYGQEVKIWKDVSDADGNINSNYGWCIYSADNEFQFENVIQELKRNKSSRRAVMIYNRPNMHYWQNVNGRQDFMCTNAVHYQVSGQNLNVVVQMRSNDAVFGYNNDYAWQAHVAQKVIDRLNEDGAELQRFFIRWQVADFHVYPRHVHLV